MKIGNSFKKELKELINKNSLDNELGIPDYVIMEHIIYCLNGLNMTLKLKDQHEKKGW